MFFAAMKAPATKQSRVNTANLGLYLLRNLSDSTIEGKYGVFFDLLFPGINLVWVQTILPSKVDHRLLPAQGFKYYLYLQCGIDLPSYSLHL